MTQEELIRLGLSAKSFLSDDRFLWFFNDELDRTMAAIVNSQPHEVKTRESLYYRHYALKEFLGSLEQYVSAMEAIVKPENDQELSD